MSTFSYSYIFVIHVYPDVDQTQGDSACLICTFINPEVVQEPNRSVYYGSSPNLVLPRGMRNLSIFVINEACMQSFHAICFI